MGEDVRYEELERIEKEALEGGVGNEKLERKKWKIGRRNHNHGNNIRRLLIKSMSF